MLPLCQSQHEALLQGTTCKNELFTSPMQLWVTWSRSCIKNFLGVSGWWGKRQAATKSFLELVEGWRMFLNNYKTYKFWSCALMQAIKDQHLRAACQIQASHLQTGERIIWQGRNVQLLTLRRGAIAMERQNRIVTPSVKSAQPQSRPWFWNQQSIKHANN